MKNAVITGATGMLGLALIRRLTDEGYTVYAVSRPDSDRIKNIPRSDGVKIIECDLSELGRLKGLIHEKCDMFFHFGWAGTFGSARGDMEKQIKNIQYTVDAVNAAHDVGCGVFLGAGSQAEYGRSETKLAPDSPAFPENGYGMAKLCAGQMSRALCSELGIKHIWCRIFSVYGPHDGGQTMIMSGIRLLLEGKRPSYTKGEQLWDYLYCADAANAFYLAAKNGAHGAVYCVGSGETRRLGEYIEIIRDEINPAAEIGIGDLPYADKQVMYLCADISSLTRDTGFKPEYSFEDGIKKTVEWYKNNAFA